MLTISSKALFGVLFLFLLSAESSARCSWEQNNDPLSACNTLNGGYVPYGSEARAIQEIIITGRRVSSYIDSLLSG
jgi:hypothetical protein